MKLITAFLVCLVLMVAPVWADGELPIFYLEKSWTPVTSPHTTQMFSRSSLTTRTITLEDDADVDTTGVHVLQYQTAIIFNVVASGDSADFILRAYSGFTKPLPGSSTQADTTVFYFTLQDTLEVTAEGNYVWEITSDPAPYFYIEAESGGDNGMETVITPYAYRLGLITASIEDVAGIVTDVHGLQVSVTEDSTLAYSTNSMMGVYSGTNGGHMEMPSVPINVVVNDDTNTDIMDLNDADTRYMLRGLVLKCADPGEYTVTVSLKMLVNDVATVIDTFDITTANYATYFKLHDLFEAQQIAGDDIQIYVRASAGAGDIAVTGQYSYAKNNN